MDDTNRAKQSISLLETLIGDLDNVRTKFAQEPKTESMLHNTIGELRPKFIPHNGPMPPSLFSPQKRKVDLLVGPQDEETIELKAPVLPYSILHSFREPNKPTQNRTVTETTPKQPFQSHHLCKSLEATSTKAGIHCLLAVGSTVWAGGLDGTVGIWHLPTGALLGSRQAHKARIFAMVRSSDGNIWTASDDNRIRIWTRHAAFFDEISLAFHLSAMVLCDNEMWCGSYDEQLIKVVDVETREVKRVFKTPMPVRYMFCDEETVWICSDEDILRINRITQEVADAVTGVRMNSLIRVGNTIWGCSSDSTISVYDRETGSLLKRLEGHEKNVYTLLPVGDHVWSGGWDKMIQIWDKNDYTLLGTITGHTQPVSHMIPISITIPLYATNSDNLNTTWATTTTAEPTTTPTASPPTTRNSQNFVRSASETTTKTQASNTPTKGVTTTTSTTSIPIPVATNEATSSRSKVRRAKTMGREAGERDGERERPKRLFGGAGEIPRSAIGPSRGQVGTGSGIAQSLGKSVGMLFLGAPGFTPRRKSISERYETNEDSTSRVSGAAPSTPEMDLSNLVPYECTFETVWTSSWDGSVLVWI